MPEVTDETTERATRDRAHDERVAAVAAAVRAAGTTGRVHIDKGGVHHVIPLPADQRFGGTKIDASALRNILHIDAEARTCVSEPGVTFEELVRATLPLGLLPAVVPELRGITVGGAVAGCSVESMSFRVGGFHDTCTEYEVVDGRGEVRTVSPTQDPDLFAHLHGSYGTLGILTKLTFGLVPAAPYVAMEYQHHADLASFEAALHEACDLDRTDGPDFVDGIIHAPDHLVLCVGRFLTHSDAPSDYTGEHIFYRSTALLSGDEMTTEQYLFRYDTECHWLSRTIPPLEWKWVRRRVGRHLLGSTNLIRWSNKVAPVARRVLRRPDVVCDVFIPASRLGRFFDWYSRIFDAWPLWVVPYRPAELYPWLGQEIREGIADGELFIDLAVYGARNLARDRDLSVLLEDQVRQVGGIKTLIGRNHYTKDRFWRVYDRPAYEKAKGRLDPDGFFPDLYDKLGRID